MLQGTMVARPKTIYRLVGNGVITGAADDDPSAIGTYASAGARYGLGLLWIAPVLLPMMYVVVYVSAKLGRVYGKGLFAALRDRYPRWLLYPLMAGVLAGNLIEAAANLGGIGAAAGLLVPLPVPVTVAAAAAIILLIQLAGSYDLIRSVFKWLALALLAYVVAAVMARPAPLDVLRGTLTPHLPLDRDGLSVLVACIGTSLSAYVCTWQSNQEVEEQIGEGKRHWWQRRGASAAELGRTRRDVTVGMLFSNVILYFIILSTGATLHASGHTSIDSAADAAAALAPVAGRWATWLFAAGMIGVGFLAVPVLTTGASYTLVQALGRKGSLHQSLSEGRLFYGTIAVTTVAAVALNLIGFNPMRALVWAGIVQGFSVPPLVWAMLRMTNDPAMMGGQVNGRITNLLGWATTAITFVMAGALVWSWVV